MSDTRSSQLFADNHLTGGMRPRIQVAQGRKPLAHEVQLVGAVLVGVQPGQAAQGVDGEYLSTGADAEGFQVISIASPLLKCVLPNAPSVDTRFPLSSFAAASFNASAVCCQ